MVEDPDRHVDAFLDAGAGAVTFHAESTAHPHRLLRRIGRAGVLRGLALSPGTPLGVVEPLLAELDLILVLAVDPGGRGDVFHERALQRVARLRELVGADGPVLSLDGGVTEAALPKLAASGVDTVVAGSAVFAQGTPGATAGRMLSVLRQSARTRAVA